VKNKKKLLELQLWNIANELGRKMDADEFRDYILGFIFYKYLSVKQYLYANTLLGTEAIKDYLKVKNADDLKAIREESLIKLGYFLKPDELFSSLAKKGNTNTEYESNFILAETKKPKNQEQQRRTISDILASDTQLRSKKELIERFIDENLPLVRDSELVADEFDI